ncbi:hypothetical protein [Pontiella sulfatireligans]|uniref:Heparinase II N-terminal domain-containing protein n=1 Tax=Pontiella sulfatireligans TaxID=2750658 RepID=A0A6C2UPT8_9BACT|nr:hypothetical protein [Pontiella sulfatireligans]VGO21943.1 hypothetical protein SCARR_04023 [Pontiella sulfatireligans]
MKWEIAALGACACLVLAGCESLDGLAEVGSAAGYNDGFVAYAPETLSAEQMAARKEAVLNSPEWSEYNADVKMLPFTLDKYQYHTDAPVGTVLHRTRESLYFAEKLLNTYDPEMTQQAIDIIRAVVPLQCSDPSREFYGVWPYYPEEPLETKKSGFDPNWADFMAVSLLDIWMLHEDRIPDDLRAEVKESLIRSCAAIKRRNARPGYTNVAIMSTYVTYMVSHMFDLPEMREYGNQRLEQFYDFTIDNGGFREFNSPTYTVVALTELQRMREHFVEPAAHEKVEELYFMGWNMVARHYHKPTGQWAGPHSRSYDNLLSSGQQEKIQEALIANEQDFSIPNALRHYYIDPVYPRQENDVFYKYEPRRSGVCWLTDRYALSTSHANSMWNQRRPLLAYFGTAASPKYMQLRLLLDGYDFASCGFYGIQKHNRVLANMSFVMGMGSKHRSVDLLTDGRFTGSDFRLRFEFGKVNKIPALPASRLAPAHFEAAGTRFDIRMLQASFNGLAGYWESGKNDENAWLDFVFYSGGEREFVMKNMDEAFLTFCLGVSADESAPDLSTATAFIKDGMVVSEWDGLRQSTPIKPWLVTNCYSGVSFNWK